MKPEKRVAISALDVSAFLADLPTYIAVVDLMLRAAALMPHSSPARKKLVADIVAATNRIHTKEPK